MAAISIGSLNKTSPVFCNPKIFGSCTGKGPAVNYRSCSGASPYRRCGTPARDYPPAEIPASSPRGSPPPVETSPASSPQGPPPVETSPASSPQGSPPVDPALSPTGPHTIPHQREFGVVSVIIVLSVIAIAFWCCKRRRSPTHSSQEHNLKLENFLLQNGSLAPKRYKYSEVKKITKCFADKLGQGGFGSVYKGMLPDGCAVAVKVLIEMGGNGEEFINEVASISRTSHVNIVNLLGYCYDKNKRALIYEYMPNKSLDKFISNIGGSPNAAVDLEKLYKIAVGVAKGLEYLQTGCNTRIVHFDIKPQNILLDEDFCPKISDFGLAKLCKKKQSIISMLGTRGTIGYIAPEIFSRNFGGVSHKSDVYSYGMMILEMAGARNGMQTREETQSSEDYFPDKIYEQAVLNAAGNGDKWSMMGDEREEEETRKLFYVGFWCIQSVPSDRPSMSKVVEMLEGRLESIPMPPKPVLFHPRTLSMCEEETENSSQV